MIPRSALSPAFALGLAPLAVPAQAHAATVAARGADPVGMFLGADPVVKAVMLVLIAASFFSWTLCVVKSREITRGIRSVHASAAMLRTADQLRTLSGLDPHVQAMADAAGDEIARSGALIRQVRVEGVGARVENRVARVEAGAFGIMRRGLPVFATIGSVGPFVGLFGTVWGIMHSFASISGARSTSLAVVAPGISEALLATALGLVAAIPATVMYNYLLRRLAAYRETLQTSATLLVGLVGREVETMALAGSQQGMI